MLVAHADSPGLEEEADACHRVVTTSNLALLSRGKQRRACGAHRWEGAHLQDVLAKLREAICVGILAVLPKHGVDRGRA
jgi:hypothetical protein